MSGPRDPAAGAAGQGDHLPRGLPGGGRGTSGGASGGAFPLTRQSVVLATRSPQPDIRRRGYARLVEAYWKPVYKYLRMRWRSAPEDAEDLTQEFFARAIEKGFLESYDPARARFRTYLRTCLDSFAANERKAALRVKRGGRAEIVSVDFGAAEEELALASASGAVDPEAYFRREFIRALFGEALAELRRQCGESGRTARLALFERYDVEGPRAGERLTYAVLARELDLPESKVVNHLAWARRRFRELVLERLREACGSDEEFRAEARELFGAAPR